VLQSGVLRLARDDADMSRLIKIAGQAVWPTDSLQAGMTGADVAALLNQDRARPGLWLRDGLVVEPASYPGGLAGRCRADVGAGG
jgi:hypothetical protein